MGKATYKGLVPPHDQMFLGGVEIFSPLSSKTNLAEPDDDIAGESHATKEPSDRASQRRRSEDTIISRESKRHCLTPYLQSFPEIRDLPMFDKNLK